MLKPCRKNSVTSLKNSSHIFFSENPFLAVASVYTSMGNFVVCLWFPHASFSRFLALFNQLMSHVCAIMNAGQRTDDGGHLLKCVVLVEAAAFEWTVLL